MTEWEKCAAGMLYQTRFPLRSEQHLRCADLCAEYNALRPSDLAGREALLRRIFAKVGKNPYVEPTIFCGFGFNIEVGDNFFANNNCVFVDPGKIIIGDDVMLAPCVGLYTAGHPLDPAQRADGYEYARPIVIGDRVWIGGHAAVLPGVTIGSDTVVGAGSVVTKDVPSGVLAFGNPCRVQRELTEADRERYGAR